MLTLVGKIKEYFTKDAPKRPFSHTPRIENSYAESLFQVAGRVDSIVRSYDPNDGRSGDRLLSALQNYSRSLTKWSMQRAKGMVTEMANQDRLKWEQNAANISRALREEIRNVPIDKLLKKYMDDQVVLIKSMPLQAAQRVHKLILENMQSGGRRAESLTAEIMRTGKVTESRAQLIARTEVSKISTGLTKARATEIGSDWYIWRTSKDIRVRDSHKILEGVLVNWDDPPSPEKLRGVKSKLGRYHAGEAPNDRCYPQPVINIDDITFPSKIYRNGSITSITRAGFQALMNKEMKRAA